MIRAVLVAGAASLLCACQPGGSGRLLVEARDGIERATKSVSDDVAIVTAGTMRVSTYGFWASNGGQELYVTYVDGGSAPVTVPVGDFAMRNDAGQAELVQVEDITGLNTAEVDLPPADPRRLIDLDARRSTAALVVPAGTTRTVSVGFARFRPAGSEPAAHAIVTAQVPTGNAAVTITFRCSGGDL